MEAGHGDRTALITTPDGRRPVIYTYGELRAEVARFAGALPGWASGR